MENCEEKLRVGALYIRVSTHDQDELSPDAQKRLGLEYAKNNNIIVPKDFIFVESVSGRNAQKRREFQRMISLAKSKEHPFDVIIVWKYSRFARNQEESIVYKSMLRKDSVEVVSVSEPLIDGPFGSLIERIIEWMDEYYSIRLSGEVMRGMKEKALRQGYQTAPCLGYNAVGGGRPFVINEPEFEIVAFIMSRFDSGYDPTRISHMCNERGYRSKRGQLFERRTVERILYNKFYYGIVVWNGIEFDGAHEARYTKEQYEERTRLLNARKRPAKSRNVSVCKHWISGVLKCSVCGATMAYGGSVSCRTFTCWKYAKGFHDESMSISVKKAEAAVFEYFDTILSGGNFTYVYKGKSPTTEKQDEIDALKLELERLSVRERRVRDAYENGIDTLEEYKENRGRLLGQRKELESELQSLSDEQKNIALPSREDVLKELRTVSEALRNPDISYEKKGVLLRTVVDQIVFDKNTGKMYFDIVIS